MRRHQAAQEMQLFGWTVVQGRGVDGLRPTIRLPSMTGCLLFAPDPFGRHLGGAVRYGVVRGPGAKQSRDGGDAK